MYQPTLKETKAAPQRKPTTLSHCFGAVSYLFLGMFLVTVATPSVFAGEYQLIKGQGVEVCEAYGKNLNAFKPKMPITCGRGVHPEFKDFSKPDWKRISETPNPPPDNRVFDKIDRFLWERDANPVYNVVVTQWPNWKGTKEQREQAWQHFLISRKTMGQQLTGFYVADLDLEGDGTPEHVYLEQNCGSSFGSLLLVLNQDYTDLDYEKTKLVMPHPSRKEVGWGEFRKLAPGAGSDSEIRGFAIHLLQGAIYRNPTGSLGKYTYKKRA